MLIFFIISFATGAIYFFTLYHYFNSWNAAEEFTELSDIYPFLSIVVPIFNDSRVLEDLLSDLSQLNYPEGKYEVLLVNDHSTDRTPQIAGKFAASRENFFFLDNYYQQGKKFAIKSGIEKASSDFIITTDADCRVPSNWLRYFAAVISEYPGSVLFSSGVIMETEQKFLHEFQALDFSSLVAAGAASFLKGSPVMCNGANLAFKKTLFNDAFEYLHPGVNTGDDMFLMIYADKNYPGSLTFLKNRRAFVKTNPQATWNRFIKQRIRWASKSTLYRNKELIMISLQVLFIHIFLLVSVILSFFNPVYIFIFMMLFSLKMIPDYLLLNSFLKYTGKRNLMKFFLPSQLLNLLFVPLTGIAGIIVAPERIVKNEGS